MKTTLTFRNHPFLSSWVFHALILLLFLLYFWKHPEQKPLNDGTIAIDVIDSSTSPRHPPTAPKPQPRSRPSSRRAVGKVRTKPVSLSDIGMPLASNRQMASRPEADETDSPYDSNSPSKPLSRSEALDDGGWDIANPDPVIARFNQYLYTTVQGWLNRLSAVNHDPLYGTVKVKIFFSGTGEYLENETIFEAEDPRFQEIVAKALKRSFENPIPKPYLPSHEKFHVERMVSLRLF